MFRSLLALPLLCLLPLVPQPALAAEAGFELRLGERRIGRLTLSTAPGGGGALSTVLSGTPLGLADGRFDASSGAKGGARHYRGESRSASEHRVIEISHRGGKVLETRVAPASEATALSRPAAVPGGVVDPVMGLAALLAAPGCPSGLRLYDGRRAVQIDTAPVAGSGGRRCAGRYRVIAGPGHLSPLGIREVRIALGYDAAPNRQLREIDLRSGPFRLRIIR